MKYVSIVQGFTALLTLPLTYFLIVDLGVLGAGIGLAAGNFLIAAMMYGWNFLNRNRYPIITYEWGRIFSFFCLALANVIFYVNLPATTAAGEIIKSISIGSLGFLSMLFLLNKNERALLVNKETNK